VSFISSVTSSQPFGQLGIGFKFSMAKPIIRSLRFQLISIFTYYYVGQMSPRNEKKITTLLIDKFYSLMRVYIGCLAL